MFRNVTIRTKLLLGSIFFTFVIFLCGFLAINEFKKIVVPFENNISLLIQDIAKKETVGSYAEDIEYYDEVLTQAARNYAFTKNNKWLQIYNTSAPKLDEIIDKSIQLGDEKNKKFFLSIEETNNALVEMEERSIALVQQGKQQEAIQLLESDEYWGKKDVYKSGFDQYIFQREKKVEKTIATSFGILQTIHSSLSKSLKDFTIFIAVLSVVCFVSMSMFSFVLLNIYSRRFLQIKNFADAIAKGDARDLIEIRNKDEISELANSLNIMSGKIKKTHSNLEQQILVRTKELEESEKTTKKALEESERALKLMVGRELEIITLKKEILDLKKKKST